MMLTIGMQHEKVSALEEIIPLESIDLLASGMSPQRRSALMEAQSDVIMRKIGFMLFQRLRCNVKLLSCINGVVSHEAALAGLPDLMLAGIADLAPLHGRVIVAVEGDLIGAVVDGMCGATECDTVQRHELSAMETRIARQMIELTYSAITEVFSGLLPLKWSIVQFETSTSMLTIAAEKDWMISTTGIFETPIGIGSIRFIAPYSGFEPLENKVASQLGVSGSSLAERRWLRMLEQLSDATPFDIKFEIIRADIQLSQLDALAAGGVLACPVLPEAVAVSGGVDLFTADYGQSDGYISCVPRQGLVAEGQAKPPSPPGADGSQPNLDRMFQPVPLAGAQPQGALASRVKIRLTVELGHLVLPLEGLQTLKRGALLLLAQRAEEPVRIYANGFFLGLGEVVMAQGQQFGIRLCLPGTGAPPPVPPAPDLTK